MGCLSLHCTLYQSYYVRTWCVSWVITLVWWIQINFSWICILIKSKEIRNLSETNCHFPLRFQMNDASAKKEIENWISEVARQEREIAEGTWACGKQGINKKGSGTVWLILQLLAEESERCSWNGQPERTISCLLNSWGRSHGDLVIWNGKTRHGLDTERVPTDGPGHRYQEKRKTPFTDGMPGYDWYYGFMARNCHIIDMRTETPLEISRSKLTRKAMDRWYIGLEFLVLQGLIGQASSDMECWRNWIRNGQQSGQSNWTHTTYRVCTSSDGK